MTILIIEDNLVLRILIKRAFYHACRELGVASIIMEGCGSIASGKELARQLKPDAICLGWTMNYIPWASDISALSLQAPVFVFGILADPDSIDLILQAGATGFFRTRDIISVETAKNILERALPQSV